MRGTCRRCHLTIAWQASHVGERSFTGVVRLKAALASALYIEHDSLLLRSSVGPVDIPGQYI